MLAANTILAERYQIEKLLSQKAGRRTFLAQDLKSQAPVIIKFLHFGDEFEWDDLKLFEREAMTLQNLNHPEIPKYLDYFDVDDVDHSGFALVQSYIDAPSLETLTRNGCKYSETEIIELADRLLSLLSYLHQQCPPVIHRDIKPSNILLANRSGNSVGDVYLVDFGSVQTLAKKERGTITIVGSYGYMPLEQFGGKTTIASDLYSLGMTLIYLLTGTHPADLPHVDGQVTFNAEISRKFERWLQKMTHPHLNKRFENASVAQLALRSEDGSYGNCDQLKPSNTKIRLRRDRKELQILYSIREKNPVATALIWFSVISCYLGIALFMILSSWGFLFLLGLSPLGLILATLSSPLSSPQTTHYLLLGINEHYIYRQQKLKNGKYSQGFDMIHRSSIEMLVYSPGYELDKCVDRKGDLINGATITVAPKLFISCGACEYSLPSHLSKAELWWLGHELSDFLNLELQVIYPTPKVSPEPEFEG